MKSLNSPTAGLSRRKFIKSSAGAGAALASSLAAPALLAQTRAPIKIGNLNSYTGAIAYGLIDSKLSVGLETKFAWEDVAADRGNYANEILLGPSIQVRPLPQMHIDLAVMAGLTDESPITKTVMIAGWEF